MSRGKRVPGEGGESRIFLFKKNLALGPKNPPHQGDWRHRNKKGEGIETQCGVRGG